MRFSVNSFAAHDLHFVAAYYAGHSGAEKFCALLKMWHKVLIARELRADASRTGAVQGRQCCGAVQ